MSWIKAICREIFGLFVDDGSFALSVLAWLAAVWLILPFAGIAPIWRSVILFVGLALILVESAVRRSRR